MGLFDKPALEQLVASGCPSCGKRTLVFRTYVEGGIPMMGGEPVGRLTWAYKGEAFVDGVYEVTCAGCHAVAFASGACPRCNASDGLAVALSTPNAFEVPLACSRCEREEVRFIAFVPAKVIHENGRPGKATTHVEPHDEGFHGLRVDCKTCGTVSEVKSDCPLCGAKGPIRLRPD